MPSLVVCPLSRLDETLAMSRARSVVTLMRRQEGTLPRLPDGTRHLHLDLSDIATPRDGFALGSITHLRDLLDFVATWDREAPLLLHCYAGVSRSTAAAFVIACALQPGADEAAVAAALRAASPTATPNPRLVELGDAHLGRAGRMIAANRSIGRGADCFEGAPFSLELQIPAYQS